MLVAVDFSVWSRQVALHACDVARAIGGRITLLHVLEDQESGPGDLEAARTLLRGLGLLARRPPSCLVVSARSAVDPRAAGPGGSRGGIRLEDGVAPAILRVADELGVELIVIGPHGQGHPTAGTLGRVVQQVLLDARVPVQVVPCSLNRPDIGRWSAALADGRTAR